jgi:hypothetical protein
VKENDYHIYTPSWIYTSCHTSCDVLCSKYSIISHLFRMLMSRRIVFSSINVLNKNSLTTLGDTSSAILSLHVRIKEGKLFDHFFSSNTYMFRKDFFHIIQYPHLEYNMGLKCKVCLQYSHHVDYLTPNVYVMLSSYINAFALCAILLSFLLQCCDCS